MSKTIVLLLLLIVSLITTLPSQDTIKQNFKIDYSDIFKEKYNEAINYINENQWINDTLKKYGISPRFALTLIFPELIRYSTLGNIIETNNLRVLYVQFGNKYSDFSIGRFQMKPSFIELLELDFNRLLNKKEKQELGLQKFNLKDGEEYRKKRVERLEDIYWQTKYIILFIRIVEKLQQVKWENEEEKVLFFATAYNVGYRKGYEKIKKEISLKRFHTEILFPKSYYCYSDIAFFFYRNYQ